jgi:hypothetical protein
MQLKNIWKNVIRNITNYTKSNKIPSCRYFNIKFFKKKMLQTHGHHNSTIFHIGIEIYSNLDIKKYN